MNIFGVGLPEIAVISALALIIFGPKRLPEFGRTLGKTLKGLQTASTEFEKEIQKAMSDDDSLDEGEGMPNEELSKPNKSTKNNSHNDGVTNSLKG